MMHPLSEPAPARPFARWMVVVMLGAYPIGLALFAMEPKAAQLTGLAVMLVSIWLMYELYRSPYWRLHAARDGKLDERELALRDRATRRAYALFTAAALVALVYLQLAFGREGQVRFWLPSDYDEASRVFWGAFLYAVTLPPALIAWDGEAVG